MCARVCIACLCTERSFSSIAAQRSLCVQAAYPWMSPIGENSLPALAGLLSWAPARGRGLRTSPLLGVSAEVPVLSEKFRPRGPQVLQQGIFGCMWLTGMTKPCSSQLCRMSHTAGLLSVCAAESDLCRSQDCGESAVDSSQFSDNAVTPEINFNNMANAMLISEGGFLRLDNLVISDLAAVEGYQYSPQQPYRSVGLGSGTWPTLALAPDSQLVLINVTMTYRLGRTLPQEGL